MFHTLQTMHLPLEYRIHLVSVYIVVVHSWQNGTRCRDGVNVLWCCSHLVWLVFEGSIPTCACFHSENFFVTCIILGDTHSEYSMQFGCV